VPGDGVAGFDIHGLSITVDSDWPEILDALRRDFTWFALDALPERPDATVEIAYGPPDYDIFEPVAASLITERNVVFRAGGRTVIDYVGGAVSVLEDDGRLLRIRGEDGWTVRRAAFDFMLSRVGAHLDRIGLPRMHGLALAGEGGGVVVMLPMGGGKTTLALSALAARVKLLSESSPLLDREGRLHAFPLPLWIRTTSPEAASLPAEFVRRLDGIDPDPLILEVAAFADLVPREPVPLRHLVLGNRSLARTPTLERLPRRAAIGPLSRDSVAGLGFFQGVEFLMRNGPRDVAAQAAVAARRAVHCRAALAQATVWRLTLGRNREANWHALARLLD